MVEHPAFNRVVRSSTLRRGTFSLKSDTGGEADREASGNPVVDADDRGRSRFSLLSVERYSLQHYIAARPASDPAPQILQPRCVRTRWLSAEPSIRRVEQSEVGALRRHLSRIVQPCDRSRAGTRRIARRPRLELG
jgi:hypothetical protein